MKRSIGIILAWGMTAVASAQGIYEKNHFVDNWSMGIDGGIDTNLKEWHHGGGVLGVQFAKGITPVVSFEFGTQIGLDDIAWKGDGYSWAMGNPWNKHHISTVSAVAATKINLMNWLGGYNCKPRLFEVAVRGGIGYQRFIADEKQGNTAIVKVGVDLDFNIGEKRAWTLSLRPSVVTDVLGAGISRNAIEEFSRGLYSTMQLTAGVTYHFANKSGAHYRQCTRPYNKREVESLTNSVNELHKENAQQNQRIAQLEEELAKKPKEVIVEKEKIVTETETKEEHSLESLVYFGQGKTTVSADQLPNVERIATFLRNNKEAKVSIEGYASPEGSTEVNERIARQRAEAVEKLLVEKYKIEASRVSAQGKGVGSSFSEPDWNRVSICTIRP